MKDNIEGLDGFNASIEQMKKYATAEIKRAVKDALVETEQFAKQRAPVGETGALRDAIAHDYREWATGAAGRVGILSPAGRRPRIIESALAAEGGTYKQDPQPFLFPAGEQIRPRLKARVREIASRLGGGKAG